MRNALYPPMDWQAHQATWPHAHLSRFVDMPGQRWHVQISGAGPMLLLLHGTGASTHSWRDLIGPLAAHYTVVCPDLTGHAFTSRHANQSPALPHIARNLCALLDHLQLWPHAVLGHSAGAAIGAQLVLDQPTRPTPVLIGLNPAWMPLNGVSSWLFPSTARLLDLNPFTGRLFAKVAGQPSVVRGLLNSTGSTLDAQGRGYYQQLLQTPSHVHGVLQMMRAWNLVELERALPRLTGPVYLHLGANDRTIAPEQAERVRHYVPQAVVQRCAGLGHLAHEEAPARTCSQILEWLTEKAR